jgi:hypothetical protein
MSVYQNREKQKPYVHVKCQIEICYFWEIGKGTLIVCSVYFFFVYKIICCFEGSFVDLLKLVEFNCGYLNWPGFFWV